MPAPSTCTVSGTLYGPGGTAAQGVSIKVYVTAAFVDGSGNYIPAGIYASTTSDSNGAWSLAVVRTATLAKTVTFRFEYPLNNTQSYHVEYPATIPNQATANFSDLVDVNDNQSIDAGAVTTDALPEGNTNLYFTSARALAALPITTKGDILTFDTAAARLPVGTDGQILKANSAQTLGVEWANETGAVSSVNGQTGVVVLDTGDISEGLNLYFTNTRADARIALQRGAANGIASLGADSKIPSSQVPAIAITDTFVVVSQAAMLALTAETGDVAVRTDVNKSFILKGTDPSVLGDWQELLTPTDAVQSVNGQTGTVSLSASDVGAQASDATLTALAALDSSAGLLAQTGADTFAKRTLTAPAAGITVSNGDGASGNPTLALANDLSALEAMSGTGIVARTASETYAQRTLTAGSSKVAVTNGDGVSGNPTVDVTEANLTISNMGGTLAIGHGGTGQTTKAAAFDALSPMTTSGDIIYGGASGTGTRLAKGSDGNVLTLASGVPSWAAPSGGSALNSFVRARGASGHGSTNTKIRIFSSTTSSGTDITYATSASAGNSFTINTAGTYSIHYRDGGGASQHGISLNSAELTTNIQALSGTACLTYMENNSGTATTGISSVTLPLAVNDVIRAHTNGTPSYTGGNDVQFIITRVN